MLDFIREDTDRWNQYFDAVRSWRYHCHRQLRYESISKILNLTSFLFSSAAFVAFSQNAGYTNVVAFLAVLVSAMNLIVKPSEQARTHRDLRDSFSDVINELEVPKALTVEELHTIIKKRRDIEKKEGPHSRALNALCEYHTRLQFGITDGQPPGIWTRTIAHLY